MKTLMIPLALFSMSLFFSKPAQAGYKFQQGQFTINISLRDTSSTPAKVTPITSLKGSALWTISDANYGNESAQITILRKTYACDYVFSYYGSDYSCDLTSGKIQQMIDDLIVHDAKFAEFQDLIKRYYDNTYYSERFEIPLGRINQRAPETKTFSKKDPNYPNRLATFEIIYNGMSDF